MKHVRSSLNKLVLCSLTLGLTLSSQANAESEAPYSFSSVWKLVRSRAPEINAAKHDLESARIQVTRKSRHWYPRVFAEGRAFSTNDPALTFMSLLGQRQIGVADFAPSALNQPGSSFFGHGTLGLDLPLFEGGAKTAEAAAAAHTVASKSFELRSAEISQYADLAHAYSSILSLRRQYTELQTLQDSVNDTLDHYKIGAKSNPVGYSGLLGLKNLRNRLEGLLAENTAKTAALLDRIRIVAEDLPESWKPQPENVRKFLSETLNLRAESMHSTESPASVRAMHLAAESLDEAKKAEKARFLPKAGLFATGDLYSGNRATGTSYMAGAYLQWDLFSAQNFGATTQAELTAAAAQARADGMNKRARMERSQSGQFAVALEKNLSIMEESTKLLEEQTVTARDLFRNGSINALQFVEVLSRRADLLVSRAEAEIALAQSRATLFVNSDVEGVSHEN